MLRACTGSDVTLLAWSVDESRYLPCVCGATFDDVQCATIYPHWNFAQAKQLAHDILLWESMLKDIDGSISS